MDTTHTDRGFLPDPDPATAFPPASPLARLDRLCRDLPSLLHDPGCRAYLRAQPIPPFDLPPDDPDVVQPQEGEVGRVLSLIHI